MAPATYLRFFLWAWLGLVMVEPVGAKPGIDPETKTWASMDAAQAGERIRWLRAEIARHDELYFKKSAPEITDAAYDELKRELATLENMFPEIAPASPAGNAPALGDDRSGDFPVYRHREPMFSLEKTYTETELRAFVTKVQRILGDDRGEFMVEPKFDGLAISVTYEGGKLMRAVTRGNGLEGDDVTANVLTISGLPRTLPASAPEVVEVRGEVFIDYAEFARINAEREAAGEEPFTHPRNLAAGTLKLKDPAEVAKRRLSLVFYGLGAWQGGVQAPETQQALHALLKVWRLPGVERLAVVRRNEVWAAVEALGRERAKLPYPTDGAVVKIDSRAAQRALGSGDDAPRWAVAYKFAPERVTTRLRAITLQVGRTGAITPVAELEPVKIGGSTVARATLHNADEIARRDLRPGDYVYVEKAGEIIPAVTGVDLERRGPDVVKYEFPEHCPSCGTVLVHEATVERCPNARCAAQVRRRIEYFASRDAVGIGGLGPTLIAKLVTANKAAGVADLYRLTREDGVPVRVLAEIDRSRRAELGRFIFGLGLPGVGRKAATELATRYRSLAALAEAEELGTEGRALIAELVALGVNPEAPEKQEKKL